MSNFEVIARVCQLLSDDNSNDAKLLLKREYPFDKFVPAKRSWSALKSTQLFWRDGFVCRYCAQPLVFPAALRVLSDLMPDDFPFHPNWKSSECHRAFVELSPTLDHVEPHTRRGKDSELNWVTACWRCNSRKANWTLKELDWELKPIGNPMNWDGLMKWFVEFADAHPASEVLKKIKPWRSAARQVLASSSKTSAGLNGIA